jgi:hypothetical protein
MEPVLIAGQAVSDPLQSVKDYLVTHGRTITGFDLMAGTSPDSLTPRLIKASRTLSSRITKAEGDWLLSIQTGAPWGIVGPTDRFVDADVTEVGGLYDRAGILWNYFWNQRHKGFATAKLSKVLFLMRPLCFPIVDSHISKRYRPRARALQATVYAARPELADKDNLTWEAFRRDLVTALPQLVEVRQHLQKGTPIQQRVADHVSDLRLFDMLAW